MQSLWSRAAARLPSSSCRCNACLRTYVNGVASRPTAPTTGRRGLRIGNAVTALYSSIFAGAAIADAKAKSKRRQEWDDKIAAVQEEVNELVDEERRLLEAISARSLPQSDVGFSQTRSYSTSSRIEPLGARSLRESNLLASHFLHDNEPTNNAITDEFNTENKWASRKASTTTPAEHVQVDEVHAKMQAGFHHSNLGEDIDDEELDNWEYESMDDFKNTKHPLQRPEPDFIWERSSIIRIKAIQKLAVQQLVYRLLLRPSIVHDYLGMPLEYELDQSVNRSPNALLRQLQGVRRRLFSLKYLKNSRYDDLMQNLGIEELDELRRSVRERHDMFLKQDIEMFLKGKMPIQQLLVQVADNLLSCEEPDRPFAFALLISTFSKTHHNDLADLVLKCLIPNLFQFSTPLIIDVITHFRKTKNLRDFDLFLQMLRGEGGYHVNLRKTWQKRTVNGVTITHPPMSSFNPVILTSLITATLRFNQPERADAYMQVARASGFVDNFATLSAFLRYYSLHKDYHNGLSTLSRALNFIVSSNDLEEKKIARLILYMADFCTRCGRDDLFLTLIHAAVQSEFDCRLAQKSDVSNSLTPSQKRWRQIQKEFSLQALQDHQQHQQPLSEKCRAFVAMTEGKINQLQQEEKHGINVRTPKPATKWKYIADRTKNATHAPTSSSEQDSASELKSLRTQLQILHLHVERLSMSSKNGQVESDETEIIVKEPSLKVESLASS